MSGGSQPSLQDYCFVFYGVTQIRVKVKLPTVQYGGQRLPMVSRLHPCEIVDHLGRVSNTGFHGVIHQRASGET